VTPKADDKQLPPNDPEAERAVLGSCLIDPDALPLVAPLLAAEDFHDPFRRAAFAAMLALHRKGAPVDLLTVADEMGEPDRGELSLCVAGTPTSMHAEHYARIVERLATRRRLMDAAAVTTAEAFDLSVDVDEAQENAVRRAMEAGSKQKRRPRPMSELVSAYYDRIEMLAQSGKPPGLPTGFTDLDNLLGGLQRSDLVLLAARPRMGKSALSTCIAMNVAKMNCRVALFSLEMSADQVVQRFVSQGSAVPMEHLKTGSLMESERAAFARAVAELDALHIYVDDTPGLSPVGLRSKAAALHSAVGLDLIIVDYLQLMWVKGKMSRYEAVTEIGQALKALARDMDLPVLALSQLNRACEARMDKRPQLHDLRESGDLEQTSNVVLMLYRDELYDPETAQPNVAELHVRKNRDGPEGMVSLWFDKGLTRFRDAEVRRTDLNGHGEVL